jgi:cupin 2 domain-containing protein
MGNKKIVKQNILQINRLPDESEVELFDEILRSENLLIERIISNGWNRVDDEWCDQDRDEWVFLVKGSAVIEFEDGNKIELFGGDHLQIPAHSRHKVVKTSSEPPCIWLAVHLKKIISK